MKIKFFSVENEIQLYLFQNSYYDVLKNLNFATLINFSAIICVLISNKSIDVIHIIFPFFYSLMESSFNLDSKKYIYSIFTYLFALIK